LFWPVLLVGGGLLWLLENLDLLPEVDVGYLIRLWPLIFVAIGLDILFGRQSPRAGALIGLGSVVLVLALVFLAPRPETDASEDFNTLLFDEPLGGATSARIELILDRYQTRVQALADSTSLIEVELQTAVDAAFFVRGDESKTVHLESVGDHSLLEASLLNAATRDATWTIGLSPEIPLDLWVEIGSGDVVLDLEGLQLSDVDIHGSSGGGRLTLPGYAPGYTVDLDGGSGEYDIVIREGADISGYFDLDSGSLALHIGLEADIELEIEGGPGSLRFDIAEGVAFRLIIPNEAPGQVQIPEGHLLVDDLNDEDEDTGVWETRGFHSAAHQVEITLEAGPGDLIFE
jgi:hypothetical protein